MDGTSPHPLCEEAGMLYVDGTSPHPLSRPECCMWMGLPLTSGGLYVDGTSPHNPYVRRLVCGWDFPSHPLYEEACVLYVDGTSPHIPYVRRPVCCM